MSVDVGKLKTKLTYLLACSTFKRRQLTAIQWHNVITALKSDFLIAAVRHMASWRARLHAATVSGSLTS